MPTYLLAIDQGTTSSRVVIFNEKGRSLSQHQLEFKQYYPANGWVEHDPEEIWQSVVKCMEEALKKVSLQLKDITSIGISNQRETTLLWHRKTGKLIHRAIVWQDRRTAEECAKLQAQKNIPSMITEKTGLLIDPYFSATKIHWLLNHVENARTLAEKGELAFGTIDTFLIWRLTGGKSHVTDATNASRTMLFNIHEQRWDDALLKLFEIPSSILPEVKNSSDEFGVTDPAVFDVKIPINGVAGDQQAATIGQACFKPGMVKSTYGTGCFVLLNTGNEVVHSQNRLLSTIAYQIKGKATYGIEGSIFVAGAAVQWLRDALHLIQKASDTESIALSVEDTGGVYLVPAFTGLGAPYWDAQSRGALLGLTRDTRVQHIVRAALEAVCYQTRDLMQAMVQDYHGELATLRVDGGMVSNDWLLQFLSDILNVPVERPAYVETSVLGAAYLAGLGANLYSSLEEISELWSLNKRFEPKMSDKNRDKLYQGWKKAITKVVANN